MKFNWENVFIYVFVVLVIVMFTLALIGYLSGAWWEYPP